MRTGPLPDNKRQKTAKAYARISRRLTIIELVIIAVILLCLIFCGLSVKISNLFMLPQPWESALYFITIVLCIGLIMMPLSYFRGYILPRRYGLSTENFKGWIIDRVKASTIGLAIGTLIIAFVYWSLTRSPGLWWLWTGLLLLLLTISLTRITPTLLITLFFKLEPLEDPDLEERLTAVAKRANTPVCGAFTINLSSKSTTANAMLAGLGNTRRIILSDTLIKQYSPDEIEVILAHELGHHIHHDIIKMIIIQSLTALLVFYLTHLTLKATAGALGFSAIADTATLPLLILFLAVLGIILTPLINTYSRYIERAADKVALQMTPNPHAFITAMTKLTDQNLSEAQPNRWIELLFYDHPSYTNRVNMAHSYIKDTA
jgi:STE24 endopeptidase